MNPVAVAVMAALTLWAVAYLFAEATVWDDLHAWLVEHEITARDFVAEGALCPCCRAWWILLVGHVLFFFDGNWDWWNLLKLPATWGLFLLYVKVATKLGRVGVTLASALLIAALYPISLLAGGWTGLRHDFWRVVFTVALYSMTGLIAEAVFADESGADAEGGD